jgi:nucleotide-binding universal stress UspA family protein
MNVLVAIDDKPSSQAIVDVLLKMNWWNKTEIHMLTVLSPNVQAGWDAEERCAASEEVEALAVEVHNELSGCNVTFVARHGAPAATVLEVAEQVHAELIVLGSNSKKTMERLMIGSVSQEVLNKSHCPVIVAKTPCSLGQASSPAFSNVIVSIDNSVFSDASIRWLTNFSWPQSTRFIVTAVAAPNSDYSQIQLSLEKRATTLSQFLRTNNVMIEFAQGEPHAAILGLAKSHGADLIVMGSHGRTGMQKMILGSVSQAVSHDAPCAVAIVRGIVAQDKSWHKTGLFETAKPEPVYQAPRRTRNDRNTAPHIVPSGMM